MPDSIPNPDGPVWAATWHGQHRLYLCADDRDADLAHSTPLSPDRPLAKLWKSPSGHWLAYGMGPWRHGFGGGGSHAEALKLVTDWGAARNVGVPPLPEVEPVPVWATWEPTWNRAVSEASRVSPNGLSLYLGGELVGGTYKQTGKGWTSFGTGYWRTEVAHCGSEAQGVVNLVELGRLHGFEVPPAPGYLLPGRYRSPDGVEGEVDPFDSFANCWTFRPDRHKPRAIVGPGFPDGLTRIGPGKTAGWVRLGDVEAGHGR